MLIVTIPTVQSYHRNMHTTYIRVVQTRVACYMCPYLLLHQHNHNTLSMNTFWAIKEILLKRDDINFCPILYIPSNDRILVWPILYIKSTLYHYILPYSILLESWLLLCSTFSLLSHHQHSCSDGSYDWSSCAFCRIQQNA